MNARGLSKEIAEEADIFFVDEELTIKDIPMKWRHESIGLCKWERIVFSGRLVYPIKDVKGNVMGLCGWDKYELPKYLDSKNHGYKAKATTFYGMEMLESYYKSKLPVFAVESIACALYLRQEGLQAIALLGSSLTAYVIQILKRFGDRLIVIPDNDIVGKRTEEINEVPAGEHLVKQVKRYCKKANVVQSRIAKDITDTKEFEEGKYEAQFLRDLRNMQNPFMPLTTLIRR